MGPASWISLLYSADARMCSILCLAHALSKQLDVQWKLINVSFRRRFVASLFTLPFALAPLLSPVAPLVFDISSRNFFMSFRQITHWIVAFRSG